MRVKCISNDPAMAKGTYRYLGSSTGNNSDKYMLTPDKEYSVYALAKTQSEAMYLILDDSQYEASELLKGYAEPTPTWYDAKLFDVLDESMDDGWRRVQGVVWNSEVTAWSFPEFASEGKDFYSRLVDGYSNEIKTFLKYVKKYEELK